MTPQPQASRVDLKSERLEGLQGLRAIAALGVILQHAIYYACVARGVDFRPWLRIGFGGLGVNLFFVISGFVMAGCLAQGRRFLWNRILRIYPGYWFAVAVSWVLLAPAFGWHLDWRSLLLLPAQLNESYRIPYWTLAYEMAFYALLAALIATRATDKAFNVCAVLWLLAVTLYARYRSVPIADPGWEILLARHNIFFVAGLLLGLNYAHVRRLPSLPLAIVAVGSLALGEVIYPGSVLASFLEAAPGFAAVLLLGVRHLHVRLLNGLGDASYGMYLVHAPIIVVAIALLHPLLPEVPLLLEMALALSAGFAGSFLFGWLEFRLHAWVRRRLSPRS